MNHENLYESYSKTLKDTSRFRVLKNNLNKNNLVDFSSNDYLNLSQSPELIEKASLSMLHSGFGSTGSRLLSGDRDVFHRLEEQIAKDKNTETALIFNSGYQANITSLATLCEPSVLGNQALIFFDKLNHASLYQGAFLSKAKLLRYPHMSFGHLEKLLLKYKDDARPKFIVSETLYGMDGDIIALDKLIALAKSYQALLYLDEAHATGILGKNGYGESTRFDMSSIAHVIMGTFSKGLGAFGAYIACSQKIKDYFINKNSGFIYSTSLPPMLIASVHHAWNLLKTQNKERSHLLSKANLLRSKLKKIVFNTGTSSTHIIPLILQKEEIVMKAFHFLHERGILVSAIRPPTVPPGSSRLRIALTLKHSEDDIFKLTQALEKL
jgi:8-amino-7-oxononanoate synthase